MSSTDSIKAAFDRVLFPNQSARYHDVPSDGPRLANLGGMREARKWGEALVRDFADYKAGKISWDTLDTGAILYGPPGTGKTMFAVVLARSCGVKLIATSLSQWMTSGDGHLDDVIAAMRRDFALAREEACILFIDELDSFPTRRHNNSADTWWTNVVTAFLEELGGLVARPGVVVIAACNHFTKLDPALVRAGRLEKHIPVELPRLDELPSVIGFHLSREEIRAVGDMKSMAVMCQGMSPAEIGRLVRDARRHARQWKHSLRRADFLAVLESEARDAEFDWRVAVHEAGHAVAALTLGVAREVNVSIVATTRSGGSSSVEYHPLMITPATVTHQLVIALSGRAAEEVVLGEISGGSGGDETSDLARANSLAWRAVTELGFSKRAPLRWCRDSQRPEAILCDNSISQEVQEMLTEAYDVAIKLARANKAKVEAVAKALTQRRALASADVRKVMAAAKLPP